jgi:hypothetical protein
MSSNSTTAAGTVNSTVITHQFKSAILREAREEGLLLLEKIKLRREHQQEGIRQMFARQPDNQSRKCAWKSKAISLLSKK